MAVLGEHREAVEGLTEEDQVCTAVGPQLLFACLKYCLPVSTTVCLSQLLFVCLN